MKKLIIALLIIVILLACADAVFDFKELYNKHFNKEEENNEFAEMLKAHYNNKTAAFEEENKSLVDIDVVFLGDSLTEGYALAEYYTEFSFVNRGIGGDTTFGVEARLDNSVFAVKPKVLVMMIGTNNIYDMFDNYESILVKLKESAPDMKVVLMSIPPTGKSLSDRNPQIALNNVEIKMLAEKYGYTYVDIFTPLFDFDSNVLRAEYTTDDLHFTPLGYRVITDMLKPIVTEDLGVTE